MRFDQTTEPLDDRINHSGCPFLSGLLLSEQAGYPEWITPSEANAAYQYLVDSDVIREDGYVLNWSKFGDWLFKPGEMRFHTEEVGYVFVDGDFAEAEYARPGMTHFIAAYPTEVDPFPNSRTRKEGTLMGYRVWSRV
jgi:hypothetical protein